METELSEEAEEYIEAIFKIQKRDGMAKTKELSQAMHIVPGSITNTIEHLESHGLVTHLPYRGVKLTRKGEKIAVDIIRKHRLAECLLTDVLKAEWSTVHEDACRLEHALTKNIAALLEERLGYPKVCPHGNPIPTENGKIEEQECLALIDADVGEKYVVDRIVDEERANLQVLSEKGIKPSVRIQVAKLTANRFSLFVEGKNQELDRELAANVLIRSRMGEQHSAAST
jgi:DtxR family Mn-dependent transcriptional regulator